ncbi:MAG: ribbon-helix-helix protein, CopG family [Clostridiales bacterium]|nr:ribbon-helix-helix protein, CopG family [Clostridiales bacterium]
MSEFKKEPLIIKRRGEDGNRVITVRIKEETLAQLDRLAADAHYSRNELINIILEHGVQNIEIK